MGRGSGVSVTSRRRLASGLDREKRAMARSAWISAGLGVLAMLLPLASASVRSQTVTPAAPAMAGQPAPIYSAQQLDQLLAPIALYPDPLLAQILMAATYPLEVVQAARWLQDPGNA